MKLKRHLKIIKSGLIGVTIIAPISATGIAVASCGKTKTPAPPKLPTFNDFVAAAEKTSAIDIVRNAKPQANGWSTFKSFTKILSPIIGTNTVYISIQESTNNTVAGFTATYTTDETYDVSNDWACTTQPPKAGWVTDEENYLNQVNDNTSIANSLITGIFNNNDQGKNDDGKQKANLSAFFDNHGGYDGLGNLGVQVNVATYSYNATGGVNKNGQITFKLVFTKSPTDKTAITSGGLFYIDRKKTGEADINFFLAGTATDINKV